jgi:hypothetical protein
MLAAATARAAVLFLHPLTFRSFVDLIIRTTPRGGGRVQRAKIAAWRG